MIAVDTSALMAIVLRDPEARDCISALEANEDIMISAGTVAEALIVAGRRGVREEMEQLIAEIGFAIIDVTSISAQRIGRTYERWGKGLHPAALNFGDCFAYDMAKDYGCPLLYVGKDFGKTDIESVL